jgi:hypothetical protein
MVAVVKATFHCRFNENFDLQKGLSNTAEMI